MSSDTDTIRGIYRAFNARDIEAVLAVLAEDVAWANGMTGGHVHGHAALRDYWTKQWEVVSPLVEPLGFEQAADGSVVVTVAQSIRDRAGQPLRGAHGLQSKTVRHLFHLRDSVVTRFDIVDPS